MANRKYFRIEIMRSLEGEGMEVYVNGNREVPQREKELLQLYQEEADTILRN